MNDKAADTNLSKLELVKAYWPHHEINTHIMSKSPLKLLDGNIIIFSDVIYVHHEIENKDEVIKKIRDGVTRITAVAKDDSPLHEMDVTEDVRCGEFKKEVKRKCVATGMCTNQTTLTMYYQNVLMGSNVVIRKDHDDKKRQRSSQLPRVIRASDGAIV